MASLVVYMFAMGQAIYFREERAGGGGGVSFNIKNKSCRRKGEQVRTQGSMGKHGKTLCKSHLFLVFV